MDIANASKHTLSLVKNSPVIPVLAIEHAKDAQSIAKALLDGGLSVLEVTLRTKEALNVIEEMTKVDGVVVGSGTILTHQQLKDAANAGAQFHVSPGATEALISASIDLSAPLLPGAVTASEMMRLLEYGYQFMKFFPAQASGGAPALKSFSGPLPQISFCPTGGVTPQNLSQYLSLPNVVCAGGSWLVTDEMVKQKSWSDITQLAKQAVKISHQQ